MIRVLLVDDDEDIRFLMRVALERQAPGAFAVSESGGGEDALARIGEIDPAIVVLDEMMPGLSGVETAARILAGRPAQAIVMCSARMDAQLRERATAIGVRDFLDKGDIRRLRAVVDAILH